MKGKTLGKTHAPKYKPAVAKEEADLYRYVEERAGIVAADIASLINSSPLDKGGSVFIHGPKNSGKTLTALKLVKLLKKKRRFVCAQPKLARRDVRNGWWYSRRGLKRPAVSFASVKDIQALFDEYEVVLVDEVMFVPYELQSHLIGEAASFIERGGWFVAMGLLWSSLKSEFVISALLKERADKAYKLIATCQICGRRSAEIGQRLVNGRPISLAEPEIVPPSETVTYEPRCWDCFVMH